MKKNILLGSVASIILATVSGISTALLVHTPELLYRLTIVSSILLGASVGLFFVGLVCPKDEK